MDLYRVFNQLKQLFIYKPKIYGQYILTYNINLNQ